MDDPRRVRRKLHHKQRLPSAMEPAPQAAEFAESQLMKSITAALTLAGFDSVKPTALEMFRSHVEEYMLEVLSHVRTSAQAHRRPAPTAQDFRMALAIMPNTRTASHLEPQLEVSLPEGIAYPSIPEPALPPPPAPDFSELLHPLLAERPPQYIPKHFPQLPSQHAWKATPVYPSRERDARKMREKATEEGMMAEQALRKLAEASNKGAAGEDKKRRSSTALAGLGKVRGTAAVAGRKRAAPDDLFRGSFGEDAGMGMDGTNETGAHAIVINADTASWRGGGAKRGLQL